MYGYLIPYGGAFFYLVLIHAATMVAVGNFLVAHLPLFIVIPYIMNLVSLISIITVLLGLL